MDEIIQYTPKFAELSTIEDYSALNLKIGEILGFPSEGTERYAPENPEPINGKYYMLILPEIQEKFPELFEGITLVDELPTEINPVE